MAPEQVEGHEADARSDIWALGAVIYEMVTGTRPFTGDSPASIIGSILKDTPPPISARQPLSPSALDDVVQHCLEKVPDQRWQTASDVGFAIQSAASLSAVARSPQVDGVNVSRAVLALAAALLLTALLGIAIAARRSVPPSPPVTRLELNMPAAVEVGSTNSPNLAISTDGKRLAFIGTLAGVRQVYVRKLDELDASALGKGTETANDLAFSPDASALAFTTADRALRKVSLVDGLVTTLSPNADFTGGGLTWGTDGVITFGRDGELWQIAGAGGPERQLTTLDAAKDERAHSNPFALPGAKAILFTVVTGGDRIATHIEAYSRATGQRKRVTPDGSYPIYASSGHLLSFRDGSVLASLVQPETIETDGCTRCSAGQRRTGSARQSHDGDVGGRTARVRAERKCDPATRLGLASRGRRTDHRSAAAVSEPAPRSRNWSADCRRVVGWRPLDTRRREKHVDQVDIERDRGQHLCRMDAGRPTRGVPHLDRHSLDRRGWRLGFSYGSRHDVRRHPNLHVRGWPHARVYQTVVAQRPATSTPCR